MDSWRTFLPSLGTVISSPSRFWRKFARSDGKKLRGFKWMQLETCISKHVFENICQKSTCFVLVVLFFFGELLIAVLFGLHHQLFGCFACGEFNDFAPTCLARCCVWAGGCWRSIPDLASPWSFTPLWCPFEHNLFGSYQLTLFGSTWINLLWHNRQQLVLN